MKPLLIVGSYLSPYVRKVLVCLELKGIPYEVDPIVPFYGNDRFSELSPLRRIPVLVDGDLVVTDSSVICQYLEELQPSPRAASRRISATGRGRAGWRNLPTRRMGDVFIWRLFNQIAIRPAVWGEKGDRALVDKTLKEDAPAVLDYLEADAPAEGFRFGALGLADIAPACFFRNAGFVRFQIDAARWPRTAAWMGRTLATPPFARLAALEDAILRTPIAEQRDVLKAAGAPISADDLRRGHARDAA